VVIMPGNEVRPPAPVHTLHSSGGISVDVPCKCCAAAAAVLFLTAKTYGYCGTLVLKHVGTVCVQVSYAQKLCPQAGDAAAPGHKQLQLVPVMPAAAAKAAAGDAEPPAAGVQHPQQLPSVAPPAVWTSAASTAADEADAEAAASAAGTAAATAASAAGPASGDAAATDAASSVLGRLRQHYRERAAHHAAQREAHRQREAAWIQRRSEQLGWAPATEPAPTEVRRTHVE
jgi:hypothetical protein